MNFGNTAEPFLTEGRDFPYPWVVQIHIHQICLKQYDFWDLKTPTDAHKGNAESLVETGNFIASLLEIPVYVCINKTAIWNCLENYLQNLKLPETIPENLKIIILPVPSRILYQSETWEDIEATTEGPLEGTTHRYLVRRVQETSKWWCSTQKPTAAWSHFHL